MKPFKINFKIFGTSYTLSDDVSKYLNASNTLLNTQEKFLYLTKGKENLYNISRL